MTCPVKGCPEPEHTPGPWVSDGELVEGDSPGHMYHVAAVSTLPYFSANVNARLIARAPDMAHALVGLVASMTEHASTISEALQRQHDALAAAEAALKTELRPA